MVLINCTVVNNDAFEGAIYLHFGAHIIIVNSVLWNPGTPEIFIGFQGGSADVTYSDVEGGWGVPMDMNIDDDPLFVDAGNGDYRLLIASPCIDVANNDDVPCDQFDLDNDGSDCVLPDVEGTPDLDLINRILPGDPNGEAIVDMGSYEFRHPDVCSCPDICPWDLDGSCDVGVSDFLDLLGAWGPCPPAPVDCPADFDNSGDVGVSDFLELLGNWGSCPCDTGPPPLSLEEELADACLTEDDWDEFVDVMTDAESSQQDKDRYDCWMRHYLFDCNNCFCLGQSGCPNPDPFN